MQVTEGYKQTEVGVIPEDWSAGNLPDLIWHQEGPGLRKWQFRSSGLKVINVTNLLTTGYLDLSKTQRHISWEEFERYYKHFLVDEGDVVMASSGNSYCKTAIVRAQDLPLLMNTSVIRFKAKETLDSSYMLIILKSDFFKDQIDLAITGGAQPNFGPYHLDRIKIPLPPTKAEQEAIARALSDADAWIESLEQLIAKKRSIKEGTSQALLTGKQRLPGFSGEWEVKRVQDFGNIVTGGTPPTSVSKYWNGEFPWITPTDINNQRDIFNSERKLTSEGLSVIRSLPANSVLITCIASIGKNTILKHAGACNQQINAIIPNIHTNAEFIYYLFELNKSELMANAGTTATAMISKATFSEIKFSVPAVKEQTAIAAILSDMDSELDALESKLSKARQIKQGMMQELLTGKTRLV